VGRFTSCNTAAASGECAVKHAVRVEGTPLANVPALDPLEMVRAIATARILMPASRVRLALAGSNFRPEAVALCFVAGSQFRFLLVKNF